MFGLPACAVFVATLHNVSIPRSEFCLFGHVRHLAALPANSCCFNSPLGILFVRTQRHPRARVVAEKFQFPARNSVCSDTSTCICTLPSPFVSIPRSEFCLFGRLRRKANPHSGAWFQFPARNSVCSDARRSGASYDDVNSFNSPLGILFVRTRAMSNGVRWFCPVSIPRSEFCLFGHVNRRAPCPATSSFNSPLGILFVRTARRNMARGRKPSFNSPLGILFVRTCICRMLILW